MENSDYHKAVAELFAAEWGEDALVRCDCPICSFSFYMEQEKALVSGVEHGGPYCGRCGNKVIT